MENEFSVHYRIHNGSPLVPTLNKISPVQALPAPSLKMYFEITVTFTSRSRKRSSSFRFPHQNPACPSQPYV